MVCGRRLRRPPATPARQTTPAPLKTAARIDGTSTDNEQTGKNKTQQGELAAWARPLEFCARIHRVCVLAPEKRKKEKIVGDSMHPPLRVHCPLRSALGRVTRSWRLCARPPCLHRASFIASSVWVLNRFFFTQLSRSLISGSLRAQDGPRSSSGLHLITRPQSATRTVLQYKLKHNRRSRRLLLFLTSGKATINPLLVSRFFQTRGFRRVSPLPNKNAENFF